MPSTIPLAPCPRIPLSERLTAAFVAIACMSLLIVASTLSPANAGVGTHMQLGLPPCGWMAVTGRPCPTCGMTTAFAAAAHGRPVDALIAQPFGAFLALMTAVIFWGALQVTVFGSRLGAVALRVLQPRALWVLGGIWLASWGYKTWAVSKGWGLG